MKKNIKNVLLIFIPIILVFCFIKNLSYRNALNLFHKGRYETVQKISTCNIKIAKEKSCWYSLRAFTHFKLKNYQKAIEDFDKAYLLSNDEFGVMNFDNKIYIKYLLKDYNGALKDFDSEIKKTADNDLKNSFLWDKAQFLFNIKKYNEALKIYNILIKKADNDYVYLLKSRLYYERAQVYDKLSQKKLAQNDRIQAEKLDLDPNYEKPIPKLNLLLDEMKF